VLSQGIAYFRQTFLCEHNLPFSQYDFVTDHFASSPAFHRVSAVRYIFSPFFASFAFSASLRLTF